MLRFAATNTMNNANNVNIAMLDKTVDIRQDTVLQLHDLSVTEDENLTPLYVDTINVRSDSSGVITNINNKFKHGVKITDRYIFNIAKNITIPLWYKYQPATAINTRSASLAINRFDAIVPEQSYKLSYAEGSYVVKNNYKVYKRKYSWEEWVLVDSADYVVNNAEETIKILNPLWFGYNIKVLNNTISDPIRVFYEDGSPVENISIELSEIKNSPIAGFDNDESLTNNFYVHIYLHEKPTKTLNVSYQTYLDYKTFIVNPVDVYNEDEDEDFTIDDDYDIITSNNDTVYYVKLPNRNSIINVNKKEIPQEAIWNIDVPSEEVTINSYDYYPKETNVMNHNRIITVEENINQIDSERIKLTYDNIYLVRGIDNKPLNISIYSVLEDGETANHDDIIEDVDVGNRILFVNRIEPINKVRTVIRYQLKLDNALIYHTDTNAHKMFNPDVSLSNYIVYMIPMNEASGNESVFFFPVYPDYKFMNNLSHVNRNLTKAIDYITSGDVIADISDKVSTGEIHPMLLAVISYINPVSANDITFTDIRRLGTDIAYDHILNPYTDTDHVNYTTVGWWWGRPMNLDNINVVYLKQSAVDRLKVLYPLYDLNLSRRLTAGLVNLDKYILDSVVKPKIRKHLRVGAKLVLEVVQEE